MDSDDEPTLPRRASSANASSREPALQILKSRVTSRRCRFPDCHKTAKPGGLCISHGGGKKCSVENCTTSMVSRGFCVAHGGGKRCQSEGCPKSAQSGGFCWIHGGGKKCGVAGCAKRAQSGGACISHGGGKRCRIDGCNKVVQCDGLCVSHGGHRKCLHSAACKTRALANGFCVDHGGRTKCVALRCQKKAVNGDYCSEHHAAVVLSQEKTQYHHILSREVRLYQDGCLSVGFVGRSGRPGNSNVELPPCLRLRSLSFAAGRLWDSQVEPRTERPMVLRRESELVTASEGFERHSRQWDRENERCEATPRDRLSVVDIERYQLSTSHFRSHRYAALLYDATPTAVSPRSRPLACDVRQRCVVATCPRFAKVDGLCLLHRQRAHAQRMVSTTPTSR